MCGSTHNLILSSTQAPIDAKKGGVANDQVPLMTPSLLLTAGMAMFAARDRPED